MLLNQIKAAETILADHSYGLVTFCDQATAEQVLASYPLNQRGSDYFFVGGNCEPFREMFSEYVICDAVHMQAGANLGVAI